MNKAYCRRSRRHTEKRDGRRESELLKALESSINKERNAMVAAAAAYASSNLVAAAAAQASASGVAPPALPQASSSDIEKGKIDFHGT